VTSEIRLEKKKENTAVKYKPFGIGMSCGLIIIMTSQLSMNHSKRQNFTTVK